MSPSKDESSAWRQKSILALGLKVPVVFHWALYQWPVLPATALCRGVQCRYKGIPIMIVPGFRVLIYAIQPLGNFCDFLSRLNWISC